MFYGVSLFQMHLGLTTLAIMSLVTFFIMTQHRTSAGYDEILENGREHREELEENIEASSAASNGGALGWRRRRDVSGELQEWRTVLARPLFFWSSSGILPVTQRYAPGSDGPHLFS